MDFLLERNRRNYLDYFNITPGYFLRRRIMTTIILTVLYGVILWLYPNPKLFLLLPLVMFFGYKLPYIELLRMKKHENIIKEYMFPTFLRYFLALIETKGNVYQTLVATIPYMEEPIKSELIKLVQRLDDSSMDSREAFLDFAEFIGSSEAYLIMGMIYEFNEEGIIKKELDELDNTVTILQENKTNELIEHKANSLFKHADPIVAGGLAYVIAYTIILIIAYASQIPF